MLTKPRHLSGIRLLLILFFMMGMVGVTPAKPVQAATLMVTNANDVGSGSLRDAIFNASAGDTITFDPSLAGQTIALSSQLSINKDLTIDGSGLNPQVVLSGENLSRIMQVTFLATNVTLSNLTFTKGFSAGQGGAIYMNGNTQLTLNNSTFSQNQGSSGGAIAIQGNGAMTILNSTLSQNQSAGPGGAISLVGFGPITIVHSTLFGNSAIGDGGAIAGYNLTLADSTVSQNTAGGAGGAIYGSGLTIKDTTIDRNRASFDGGAIEINGNGFSTMVNSTVFQNQAGAGGGAILATGTISMDISNSTFGGNTAADGKEVKLFGVTTLNLRNTIFVCTTGSANCYTLLTASAILTDHSILGIGSLADYGLAELADNGGPTQTMALLSGSPLINAGEDANCPATDQRGLTRPQGSHCDMGAYEYKKKSGNDTTGVFRPSNGALYLKNSNTTGFADIQINYGLGGDTPIVGDWDGDGNVTIGIYRNGSFYLRNSNTIGFADVVFPFGMPGDQPIAGDWNGDGIDTLGVYRSGTFFLRNSNSVGVAEMSFALGVPGDVGIAGDWDGDGLDTTGVFRPSNGALYLKNANITGFADIQINYGLPGDKPLTGDWDNDGIDTIGIYRNGTFYLRNSNTIGFADIVFDLGIPGDMPIAGNWDALP